MMTAASTSITQEDCEAWLARIAEAPASVAGPGLLALVARLAAGPDWLDGDLAIELFEEDACTRVRVMTELGGGMRERVLPAARVRTSVDEMTRLADRAAEHLGGLRVERISSRCLMLVAGDEADPASTDFDISETSLATIDRGPAEIDAGWDN